MRILSNRPSAKFSASRPLLPAYNFSATMATTYSTYRFRAVASLKWRLKICLPTFRPMSIIAKRLDGSGYYLIRRYASVQAILC